MSVQVRPLEHGSSVASGGSGEAVLLGLAYQNLWRACYPLLGSFLWTLQAWMKAAQFSAWGQPA